MILTKRALSSFLFYSGYESTNQYENTKYNIRTFVNVRNS